MTTYYSKSRKGFINIENMNDQHIRNAFILQCKDLELIKENEQQILFEGSIEDVKATVNDLKHIINDRDNMIEFLREQLNKIHKTNEKRGHNYVFAEIPNDTGGHRLVNQMKSYLNKDTYKLRIRGQHLKEGLNWKEHTYGQSIDDSKCLRVYVEEKYK
tara:strand:- start:745 stop:1221 length:477 start_codon:yes stop_codon:yes gene_type:complete